MRQAKHEKARLERRREIARQSAIQFEDQLSNAELIVVRLDALPEGLRQDDHDTVRERVVKELDSLRVMVDRMYQEAGPDEPASEEPNRAQRRAAARKR